jgi:hypothetical protein
VKPGSGPRAGPTRRASRGEIADTNVAFRREQEQVAAEAALDGIYVLRSSVPANERDTPEVVGAYKYAMTGLAPATFAGGVPPSEPAELRVNRYRPMPARRAPAA